MGFFGQKYWSGLLCPPPGHLPYPGMQPTSFMSPALADMFFTISNTWEAPFSFTIVLIFAHLINYSRELSILTIFKDPTWASLVAQLVKNSPAVQETPV